MKSLAIKLKRKFSNGSERSSTSSNKAALCDANSGSALAVGETDFINTRINFSKEDLLVHVPAFRDVSPDKRKQLFVRKLRLASIQLNFTDINESDGAKDMKKQILLELVDHVTTNKGWSCEVILEEILDMVAANIFRGLPPPSTNKITADMDDDEPALDPAWQHLQIVYEFLLRFIVSTEPDPKILRKKLRGRFIQQIIAAFRSEDPREREYLKTILHRIYGKFMSMRSSIRKYINHALYDYIYRNEQHRGICEFLEILGSIVNGFASPLKMEHKKFMRNVLIPLHKTIRLQAYHQQLTYCLTQFIEKDSTLSLVIIGGIIKMWPLTSAHKQVLMLNELEEMIELTPHDEIQTFIVPIFKRVALCIGNQHFQVAERALFFWNNDLICSLCCDYKNIIFPIVVPVLESVAEDHWSKTVQSLALNVARMLSEMDKDLHSSSTLEAQQQKQDQKLALNRRETNWKQLRQRANMPL